MSQTIGQVNVMLGMNTDGLQRGTDLAAKELRQLSNIVRQSEPPADKLSRQIALLNRALDQGRISQSSYANAVEHLKNKLDPAAMSANKFQVSIRQITADVTGVDSALLGAAGKAAAFSAALIATKSVTQKVLGDYLRHEESLNNLITLLGSTSKAQETLNQLRVLEQQTPLNMQDFMGATQTLLGFGMASEKLIPVLKTISDVSLGNSQRFQALSLAMAQVQAAGKLTGGDLLQMVNAGFNPLEQISRRTGVAMGELRKQMEKGAITATMVEQAFRGATEQGGRFFGAADRQANSLGGSFAKIEGAITVISTKIGEKIAPDIRSAAEGIEKALGPAIQLLDKISQFDEATLAPLRAMANNPLNPFAGVNGVQDIIPGIKFNKPVPPTPQESNIARDKSNAETKALIKIIENEAKQEIYREQSIDLLRKMAQTNEDALRALERLGVVGVVD
jgi:tape measure domain-containing protein